MANAETTHTLPKTTLTIIAEKQAFFNQPKHLSLDTIDTQKKSYEFLTKHYLLIEQEFSDLMKALQTMDEDKHKDAWYYAYYCCHLLEQYYQGYDKPDKIAHYQKHKCIIKQKLGENSAHISESPTPDFMARLQVKVTHDIKSLVTLPFHVSKLEQLLGLTNLIRFQIVFSKLLVATAITAAHQAHYLDAIDNMCHHPIDLAIMDQSTFIFNFLSVGIFASRFALNMGMLIKHVFFPTDEAKTLSWPARLKQELLERHVIFINDLVWGVVNGLTNYAQYFNIPATTAAPLMAGFMGFDVLVLLYMTYFSKQQYDTKKSQYEE